MSEHLWGDQAIDLPALFGTATFATLKGIVHSASRSADDEIVFTFGLSFAEVRVAAASHVLRTLPIDGDVLRVRLMRRRSDPRIPMRAVHAEPATLMHDQETSWLPDRPCLRPARLQRLRRVLSSMPPPLQAMFFAATVEPAVQHRLLTRMAASDHHVYPAGLFDQSVQAAEHAWMAWHPNATQRGHAALAALLFDIGKVSEATLSDDGPRLRGALQPHPLTACRIARAIDVVARTHPEHAAFAASLLAPPRGEEVLRDPERWLRVRDAVREAVAMSWVPLIETELASTQESRHGQR
jgi:hypothetical protein